MSTYYSLACKACSVRGGFASRQAWGWGNFDIFSTFEFMARHAGCCHAEPGCVIMISEDSDLWECEEQPEDDVPGVLPCSDDWERFKDRFSAWKAARRS